MLDDQDAPETEAQAALVLAPAPKRKRGRPNKDERLQAQIAETYWRHWHTLPAERRHIPRCENEHFGCELVDSGYIARALNSESGGGGTTLALGGYRVQGGERRSWNPYKWCADKVRKELGITLATPTIRRIADKRKPQRIEPLRSYEALDQLLAPMDPATWSIWQCVRKAIHPRSGIPARLTAPEQTQFPSIHTEDYPNGK